MMLTKARRHEEGIFTTKGRRGKNEKRFTMKGGEGFLK